MSKDKLTTIFGLVAAAAETAHASGITVGHFGGSDFVPLIGGVALAVWGWLTNKK